jgi:hypothetical protein
MPLVTNDDVPSGATSARVTATPRTLAELVTWRIARGRPRMVTGASSGAVV